MVCPVTWAMLTFWGQPTLQTALEDSRISCLPAVCQTFLGRNKSRKNLNPVSSVSLQAVTTPIPQKTFLNSASKPSQQSLALHFWRQNPVALKHTKLAEKKSGSEIPTPNWEKKMLSHVSQISLCYCLAQTSQDHKIILACKHVTPRPGTDSIWKQFSCHQRPRFLERNVIHA